MDKLIREIKNAHIHLSFLLQIILDREFKNIYGGMYCARNLEMSIRFSLKSRPSEQFHRPEMSQIKAEISLRTNVKLICHKNVGLQ